jgi:hypothetical protein
VKNSARFEQNSGEHRYLATLPVSHSTPVLPGPEAASPPIQRKSTAICRKLTAISNFSKIPLFFR